MKWRQSAAQEHIFLFGSVDNNKKCQLEQVPVSRGERSFWQSHIFTQSTSHSVEHKLETKSPHSEGKA